MLLLTTGRSLDLEILKWVEQSMIGFSPTKKYNLPIWTIASFFFIVLKNKLFVKDCRGKFFFSIIRTSRFLLFFAKK